MRHPARIAAATALFALSLPAPAVLLDRGNGLLYDTVLDLTWLQDANSCNGCFLMNWYDAVAWAANLEVAGATGWRLPKIRPAYSFEEPNLPPVDCSVASALACAAGRNELGYMFFHNLGGTVGADLTGDRVSVSGAAVHDVQGLYWGGNSNHPSFLAWAFGYGPNVLTESGTQAMTESAFPEAGAKVWAVHAGDVAAVPEPSTLTLMAAAMLVLAWSRKKRGRVTSLTPGTGCNA